MISGTLTYSTCILIGQETFHGKNRCGFKSLVSLCLKGFQVTYTHFKKPSAPPQKMSGSAPCGSNVISPHIGWGLSGYQLYRDSPDLKLLDAVCKIGTRQRGNRQSSFTNNGAICHSWTTWGHIKNEWSALRFLITTQSSHRAFQLRQINY